MSLDDLVHDDIPVNQPYEGLIAEAYDVWMPPYGDDADVEIYRRAIEHNAGPALELGCGTGRLLLGYARAGYDVEGVDASADMLAICAAHARAGGFEVTLHHADWLTLDLDRTFATIYNPAGSFSLIASDDDARTALAAWRRHLRPGGEIVIPMGVPTADFGTNYEWRLRRSATRERDGVTFMVQEAVKVDTDAQVQHILNRHEVWAADGTLVTTFMRRHRLRYWTRDQFEGLLRDSGFEGVQSFGADDEFLVVGFAPAAS